MKTFLIEPLDTLFFRDGRPFNAGETGQMEVDGHFPPAPTTLVGALRAALARSQGWSNSKKDWSEEIKQHLGDGPDLAAGLHFYGPYVVRCEQPLFPAPLLLMGKSPQEKGEKWTDFIRLRPAKHPLTTDRGTLRLPEPVSQTNGHKALERCYLSAAGMQAVLDGGVPSPEQVFYHSDLWKTEPRVGILRDRKTRTTGDNALYLSSHVRLCSNVCLGVSIKGLPDDWEPDTPAPLGGESRLAWIKPAKQFEFPKVSHLNTNANGKLRYTVTLITPYDPSDERWRNAGQALFGLPGKIISACVGKPQLIGGWDSLQKRPLPLKPHLPPGSTWFIEAESSEKQEILDMNTHIGKRTEWGYGQILIGTWEEAQ